MADHSIPKRMLTYVPWIPRKNASRARGRWKKLKSSFREEKNALLSKMMISGANVLLLDEPTNHLDMESITALNNGLIKFPGVLLFTSRDHQIVQTTANRIMEIVPGGQLIDKITTYDEYLESDEMATKKDRHILFRLGKMIKG